MSCFKSITKFLLQLLAIFRNAILTRSPPSEALAISPLKLFPLEIILIIASFLPVEEAASFSLSCRLFYDLFGGPRIVESFKDDKQLQYKFLDLLERDLPGHILCYHCKQLHRISKFKRYLPSSTRASSRNQIQRPCAAADHEFAPLLNLHSGFCYTIFQMAMRQYRISGDCPRLLTHLSYTSLLYRVEYVEERHFSVKITNGCLLVRQQTIFRMSAAHLDPVPRVMLVRVCPHFNSLTSATFDWQGRIREYQLASWLNTKVREIDCEEVAGSIIPCKYCMTELRIDTKNSGKDGRTVIITRWKNLGEGRTPMDHKWWSHGDQGSSWAGRTAQLLLLRSVFDRESPADMFEGDRGNYDPFLRYTG